MVDTQVIYSSGFKNQKTVLILAALAFVIDDMSL